MVRPLSLLLSGSKFALDVQGIGELALRMLANERSDMRQRMLAERPGGGDNADSWETYFIKKYGHAHYYVTPRGEVVHSLDSDINERLSAGSIAIVPVRGAIVKEADLTEEAWYHVTSSRRITNLMPRLAADVRVAGMVMDTFSPGGHVYGTEAAGKAIAAFTAVKPSITHVDAMACSAAYWYACNTGTILLDGQTSDVGSIGVVQAWMDLIPLMEKFGGEFRMFFPKESSKKWEEYREIREKGTGTLTEDGMSPTAQLFHATVRAGRGERLNTQDKAVLEGRVYGGDDAIAAGLADGYGTLQDAVDQVRATANVKQPTTNQKTMSLKTKIIALFSSDDSLSAEDIKEINATMSQKGITGGLLMSTEEANAAKAAATRIEAAEETATKANAKAEAAETKVTTLTDELATEKAAREQAESKVTSLTTDLDTANAKTKEVEEKVTTLTAELATEKAAREAADANLATANGTIAKMEEEHGTDGKPSRVVGAKGDVREPATDKDENIPGAKEFAEADLEEHF